MGRLITYFIFLSLAFSACKTRVSLSGATIPDEAKTVSVGFFTNNTSLGAPSLSQRFTEKLRDVVSQQTRLTLIKQNGDHLLKLFKSKVSPFINIIDKNIDWYMAQLTQEKESKLVS